MLLQEGEKREPLAGRSEIIGFSFGEFHLDPLSRILSRSGVEIHLPRRPFAILETLIENRERVVTRTELLDSFWEGHEVYDDALRKCVGTIRKALDDTAKPSRFIETRYGGGFRFVAPVEVVTLNGNGSSNSHVVPLVQKDQRRNSLSLVAAVAGILAVVGIVTGFYAISSSDQVKTSQPVASGESQIKSVMVLPLRNVSGDASNDYLSDGVTESIITQLSRAKDLRIISSTPMFAHSENSKNPFDVGRELNADAVLEGSLQRNGDNVNIRVRLVRVSDGSVVWTSNDFERSITNAYDLQEAIACDVSAELRAELCGGDSKTTRIGLAYQEYLKGRFEWNKRTPSGIKKSIEHYNLAIKFDPTYSLAYSGLAESYTMGLWYVPFPTEYALPKATDAAKKAIELDASSAAAHAALASVASLAWRWDEAESEIQKAIEADPHYARAFHISAFFLTTRGRYEEAIAAIRKANELDPLNVVIRADTANIMLHGHRDDPRRIDDAIAECDRLIASNPEYAETYDYPSTAYMLKGDADRFATDFIEGKRRRGETDLARYSDAFGKQGVRGILNILLSDELRKAKSGPTPSMRIGTLYAAIGDKGNALKWLNRAADERSAEMIGIAQNPWIDPVRNEPEFKKLLIKVGL